MMQTNNWFFLSLACLALSGCNWNRFFRQPDRYVQPPQVFRAEPTREELIARINDNTSRVQTLQASGSLSIPRLPSLATEIAYERVTSVGAVVTGVIPMVDRGDIATERFAKRGVPFAALVSYRDLGIEPVQDV